MFTSKLRLGIAVVLCTALGAHAQDLGISKHPGIAPPAITNAFGARSVQLSTPPAFQGRGSVSGVVLDGLQNPVAGATVTVTSGSVFGGGGTVTTDLQGRFQVHGVAVGPFQVSAGSSALRLAGEARGSIHQNEESLSLDIGLGASATLTGTVREANGGVPAANAQVVLSNGLTTTADSNGNFAFQFVPLGRHSMTTTDSTGAHHGAGTVSLTAQDEILTTDIELNRSRTAQTTPLTFTITNPNASAPLSDIGFTNPLPAGLLVASPSHLSGDCSGTTTAAAGANSIALSGATLAAGASCSFSVNVTGIRPGEQAQTTGPISSRESGLGAASNIAILVVVSPPSIVKSFSAASIALNGSVTLTFTITNPNGATDLTGVSFNDTLPSGLIIANPDSLTGTCDPGVITPAVTSINLVGGTILAGSSCTFSVDVLAVGGGTQVNTTDPVTSNEGGTGNTATASVIVLLPDMTITKTHTGNFTQGQVGATYTITVTNSGAATTNAVVSVTDTLPSGLTATAISGTGWLCSTLTSCSRPDLLDPGLSFPPITVTVNVAANAAATVTNTATVSGGGEANTSNDTASDPTNVTALAVAPLILTSLTDSVTVHAGDKAQFLFMVTSNAPSLGPINFSCSGLPAGALCSFDMQGESQPSAQVTLTVNTDLGSTAALLPRSGNLVVAAIAIGFPLVGLVSLGRRRKPALAALLGGLLFLLALSGCGVAPKFNVLPRGSIAFSVTATSSATPAVQSTSKVTLVVK